MPRQIEYDASAVRQSILDAFWLQGFEKTSLRDLESASGLNRRQLYNGLGDKRSMFLQALDDFVARFGARLFTSMESSDAGLSDIENLLNTLLEIAEQGTGPVGCMVCSASQESIASDEGVRVRIDAYFARVRAAYRNALVGAVRKGEVALSDEDVETRSDVLFGCHVSLCILARAGRPVAQLRRLAKQALLDIH
ncbi:MAG: TetR/AcrR family transcriptional regulator [Myxococcota bacterium]